MAAAQDPTPTTAVNIIATADGRPNPQPPSSSRRLPPPCWSHEETVALIDSYRDKWYSLRRGNLKALHWQEVADAIAHRCPLANPSKTSVQCRHKVEKLRKRYRTEKQKALSNPGRFSSSWVYFRKMEAMEKGPSSSSSAPPRSNSSDEDDDGENDDANEEDGEDDDPMPPPSNTRSLHRLLNNGVSANGDSEGGLGGFRLRIPCRATMALPAVPGFQSKGYDRVFDESPYLNPSHNLRYMSGFLVEIQPWTEERWRWW